MSRKVNQRSNPEKVFSNTYYGSCCETTGKVESEENQMENTRLPLAEWVSAQEAPPATTDLSWQSTEAPRLGHRKGSEVKPFELGKNL